MDRQKSPGANGGRCRDWGWRGVPAGGDWRHQLGDVPRHEGPQSLELDETGLVMGFTFPLVPDTVPTSQVLPAYAERWVPQSGNRPSDLDGAGSQAGGSYR